MSRETFLRSLALLELPTEINAVARPVRTFSVTTSAWAGRFRWKVFRQDNGEGTSSRQGRPFLAAAEIDALPSNRNGALAWPAGAIRLKAHLFLTVVLDVLDVRGARGGLPSLLVPERIGFLLQ